jgi:hypothetical protein
MYDASLCCDGVIYVCGEREFFDNRMETPFFYLRLIFFFFLGGMDDLSL